MRIKIPHIKFIARYQIGNNPVSIQVFPLFQNSKISDIKENQHILQSFDSELTFINSPGENIYDFDIIKACEQADISTRINIDIYVNDIYKFDGYFYPFQGSWNNDTCRVTVKLATESVIGCLMDSMDIQRNIINIPPQNPYRVDYEPKMMTFVCEQAQHVWASYLNPTDYIFNLTQIGGLIPQSTDNGLPFNGAGTGVQQTNTWYSAQTYLAEQCLPLTYNLNANDIQSLRVLKNEFFYISNTGNTALILGHPCYEIVVKIKTTWIAEYIITVNDINGNPVSPGAGWVQYDPILFAGMSATQWLREPYNSVQDYRYQRTINNNNYQVWELINPYAGNPVYHFTNQRGRDLTDVINYFLVQSGCNLNYHSDFFLNTINPVTGTNNRLTRLNITNVYDFVNHDPSDEPRQEMKMSFNDLLSALEKMFNVYWHIKYIGGNWFFVLEHLKYYENGYTYNPPSIQQTVDITGQLSKWTGKHEIIFTNKYSYDVSKIFKNERWQNQAYFYPDFFDVNIKYNIQGVPQETIISQPFVTDISGVIDEPGHFSDDQIILVALEYDPNYSAWFQVNEPGMRTNQVIMNGHLCLINLITRYWQHGRVFLTGKLDGVQTTFLSEIKKIIQDVTIKDCDDVIESGNLIKTNLGTGEIQSQSWDILTKTKELKLLI